MTHLAISKYIIQHCQLWSMWCTELINLTIGSLYPWTISAHLPHASALGYHHSTLYFHEFGFSYFVKCSFCICHLEIIILFLSLILLMWYIAFIDLCMLNHSCIPGINPIWSWDVILLMCCSIWIGDILLRVSGPILRIVYWFIVCFLVVFLHGFGNKIMLAAWKEMEWFFSLHFFERVGEGSAFIFL